MKSFAVSPDGAWALYSTSSGLYSAPLSSMGPGRTLLEGLSSVNYFFVTPDSRRALAQVYDAGIPALWSAPLVGMDPGAPLYVGTGSTALLACQVSPDAARCIQYWSNSGTYVNNASTVAVDGAGAPADFHPWAGEGLFTPDSSAYVYATLFQGEGYYLYRAQADASPGAIELSDEYVPGNGGTRLDLIGLRMTPDGAWIVFRRGSSSTNELWKVPADGSAAPISLSGPTGLNGVERGFQLDNTGANVVYLARSGSGPRQLWSVPIDASQAPRQLNAPLIAAGNVDGFLLSPDGARVVYIADQEVDQRPELYSVPIDTSSPALRINGPIVPSGRVRGFQVTPDGTRVVYLADSLVVGRVELFVAPITGGVEPVRLCGVMANDRAVQPDFLILADSSAVVFRADLGSGEKIELWLARLDGSSHPIRRCRLEHPEADVTGFEITGDQRYVVYRADAQQDEAFQLFRFPLARTPLHARR